MKGAVYKQLKKRGEGKGGSSWVSLTGFTANELMAHLEPMFRDGMTWENYGWFWHVDHKRPMVSFDFSSPSDDAFKQCWSLSNLQPLLAKENLKKGARYVEDI